MPNDNSEDPASVGGIEVLVPSDAEEKDMPGQTDPDNLTVALTAMANGFGAAATRRNDAADQLASDSQRMWSIAMTSPTVMAAHGMRVANESGAGRSRIESNTPASSQTVGG